MPAVEVGRRSGQGLEANARVEEIGVVAVDALEVLAPES
jgi:hypothetical protein